MLQWRELSPQSKTALLANRKPMHSLQIAKVGFLWFFSKCYFKLVCVNACSSLFLPCNLPRMCSAAHPKLGLATAFPNHDRLVAEVMDFWPVLNDPMDHFGTQILQSWTWIHANAELQRMACAIAIELLLSWHLQYKKREIIVNASSGTVIMFR